MKRASCLAACLTVLTVSQAFAGRQSYFGNVEPPKEAKKVTAPADGTGTDHSAGWRQHRYRNRDSRDPLR